MIKKKLLIAVSVCLLLAVGASAQAAAPPGTLSQSERDRAVQEYERTRAKFLESVKGLMPEQWNFKPAPDRWSVAEVAEHITVSEEGIMQLVRERILATPVASAEEKEKTKGKEEAVLTKVVDRSVKAQAPEFLKPSGRWKSEPELVQEYEKRRGANIAYIKTTNDPLHDHVLPHPAAGPLDGYEWLLLISAHSERHTAQIEEVKADPNFPKAK